MFKLIIAGLGWWGKVMIQRLSSSKKVKIVNLIEPYPDKEALQLAKNFNLDISNDFEQAVKSIDFDGIVLCTPNSFHKDQTILCANLKKHVFCEKPPARNYKELKLLKKILDKNKKLKLKYGFNHRYHGSVKKAENLIKSKTFGKIINLRAVYGKSKIVTFGKNEWRSSRKKAGGGILLDQGIHMLDLIYFFAGKFNNFKSFIGS